MVYITVPETKTSTKRSTKRGAASTNKSSKFKNKKFDGGGGDNANKLKAVGSKKSKGSRKSKQTSSKTGIKTSKRSSADNASTNNTNNDNNQWQLIIINSNHE